MPEAPVTVSPVDPALAARLQAFTSELFSRMVIVREPASYRSLLDEIIPLCPRIEPTFDLTPAGPFVYRRFFPAGKTVPEPPASPLQRLHERVKTLAEKYRYRAGVKKQGEAEREEEYRERGSVDYVPGQSRHGFKVSAEACREIAAYYEDHARKVAALMDRGD